DGRSFFRYSEKSGLSSGRVWTMLEDRKGNIWFGTSGKGLTKFDGKTFTHHRLEGTPGSNSITCLKETKPGKILIGTDGGGLFIYDGKTFTNYTENEGLSYNSVWSLEEDKNQNLWVGTDKGLSCFIPNPQTRAAENPYQIRVFHMEDGLKAEDFVLNSVCLDSKNQIWWGTGKAVTRLDLNTFQVKSTRLPQVQLSHLDLQGEFADFRNPLSPDKKESGFDHSEIAFSGMEPFKAYPRDLDLPHSINHLTFYLSAIDWAAPEQVKYRFRLDGMEKEWSNAVSDNKADYRDIPPGKYTFMVEAIGNSGQWSKPFEYSFTIRPPWWKTWWAYTIYALLAVTIIISIVWWNGRRLRARAEELKIKVDE
ncbi:MAG: two-component regulator propeller domain-containing protein, partial [Flavobacteriales bacterium]